MEISDSLFEGPTVDIADNLFADKPIDVKPVDVPVEGRNVRTTTPYQQEYIDTKYALDEGIKKQMVSEQAAEVKRIATKKRRAATVYSDKLEETTIPTFLSGRKYTTDSLLGKYNTLVVKNKVSPNEAQAFLVKQGATPSDMLSLRKEVAGQNVNGTELIQSMGKLIKEGAQVIGGMQVARQAGTTELLMGGAKALISMAPFVDDATKQEIKTKIDKQKAHMQAMEDAYAEHYGQGVHAAVTVGREAPIAFVTGAPLIRSARAISLPKSALRPEVLDTVSKVALLDRPVIQGIADAAAIGGATYVASIADDFDETQAVSHSIIAATVGGALGHVGAIAEKRNKLLDGVWEDIKDIKDLPSELQSMVTDIKKQTGWSDDTITDMINGYRAGTKEGQINAVDAVRMLALRSGTGEVRNALKHGVFANETTARQLSRETTSRAKEFIASVNKLPKEDRRVFMGLAQSNTLHINLPGEISGGARGINWLKVADAIEDRPELVKPHTLDVVTMARRNKELYGSYDPVYLDLLGKKLGTEEQVGRSLPEMVMGIGRNILHGTIGKSIAEASGSPFFMRQNVANSLSDLLIRTFGSLVPFKSKIGQYSKVIEKSLLDGTYNPRFGEEQFRRMFPTLDDNLAEDVGMLFTKAETAKTEAALRLKEAQLNAKKFPGRESRQAVKDADILKRKTEIEYLRARHGYQNIDDAEISDIHDIRPSYLDSMTPEDDVIDYVDDAVPEPVVVTTEQYNMPTKVSSGQERVQRLIDTYSKRNDPASKAMVDQLKRTLNTKTERGKESIIRNAVFAKVQTGISGEESSKASQRLARQVSVPYVFGEDFSTNFEKLHADKKLLDERDYFSQYLIDNKDMPEVTKQNVQKYYTINPSRVVIGDRVGFGIPRAIREEFGLEQKEIKMPPHVMRMYRNVPLSKSGDGEAELRDLFFTKGCDK